MILHGVPAHDPYYEPGMLCYDLVPAVAHLTKPFGVPAASLLAVGLHIVTPCCCGPVQDVGTIRFARHTVLLPPQWPV